MRPYTYRKCEFCPSTPPAFQPMHPSQLVPGDEPILEPEGTLPGTEKATSNRTAHLPYLQEVCSIHISLVRHIPPEVATETADLFRHALQGAVDATENGEALLRFTKIPLLPAAPLSAPKLRSTEATGTRHHTIVKPVSAKDIYGTILVNMNMRYTTFLCPSQIQRSKPEMRHTALLPTRGAACL